MDVSILTPKPKSKVKIESESESVITPTIENDIPKIPERLPKDLEIDVSALDKDTTEQIKPEAKGESSDLLDAIVKPLFTILNDFLEKQKIKPLSDSEVSKISAAIQKDFGGKMGVSVSTKSSLIIVIIGIVVVRLGDILSAVDQYLKKRAEKKEGEDKLQEKTE